MGITDRLIPTNDWKSTKLTSEALAASSSIGATSAPPSSAGQHASAQSHVSSAKNEGTQMSNRQIKREAKKWMDAAERSSCDDFKQWIDKEENPAKTSFATWIQKQKPEFLNDVVVPLIIAEIAREQMTTNTLTIEYFLAKTGLSLR